MRVLVTAIGSMSAECVIDSFRKEGLEVVGTDIYPKAYHPVAGRCVSFFRAPLAVPDQGAYCAFLAETATRAGCAAVVPLTDPEVDAIAANRGMIESAGVSVWQAGTEAIRRARAKERWGELLGGCSAFRTIPTYLSYADLKARHEGRFVAKRINGRSSEGILFADTRTFADFERYGQGYMFQPLLEGDVVTVDFVRHPRSGQVVCLPRKELMRTKNGAGVVVEVMSPDLVRPAVSELVERLGLSGVMNCEFILRQDGSLFLMDVNPRFSAGVSFSRRAGYDFVRADRACYMLPRCEDAGPVDVGAVLVKRFSDFG